MEDAAARAELARFREILDVCWPDGELDARPASAFDRLRGDDPGEGSSDRGERWPHYSREERRFLR